MNTNLGVKDKPRKNALVLFIHKLGSPAFFYNFSGKFIPWLWLVFLVLAGWALYLGLVKAPADYLQGDRYFKIHRKGHNLDRARKQFKMVASMEEKFDIMEDIVRNA